MSARLYTGLSETNGKWIVERVNVEEEDAKRDTSLIWVPNEAIGVIAPVRAKHSRIFGTGE